MLEVIFVITSLGVWNNYEIIETAKAQYEDGHRWEYIGKKDASPDIPTLPIIGPDGKELVYFKLDK